MRQQLKISDQRGLWHIHLTTIVGLALLGFLVWFLWVSWNDGFLQERLSAMADHCHYMVKGFLERRAGG